MLNDISGVATWQKVRIYWGWLLHAFLLLLWCERRLAWIAAHFKLLKRQNTRFHKKSAEKSNNMDVKRVVYTFAKLLFYCLAAHITQMKLWWKEVGIFTVINSWRAMVCIICLRHHINITLNMAESWPFHGNVWDQCCIAGELRDGQDVPCRATVKVPNHAALLVRQSIALRWPLEHVELMHSMQLKQARPVKCVRP